MKNIIFSVFVLLLFSSFTHAKVEFELQDFLEQEGSNLQMGYVNIDSNSYLKAAINPDFPLGPLSIGLALNLYLPLGDYGQPKSTDWIALRYLGYDYQKKYGFKYGQLRRITLGQGLLVENFNSGSGGNIEFTTKKAGILGYITVLDTKITAMRTAEEVQALRVQRPVMELSGVPVIVGATYAEDVDGIDDDSTGKQINRNSQVGYAADISYPIGGPFFTLYAEGAHLEDQATGYGFGAKGSVLQALDYKAEIRHLEKGFAPGYFNSTYQATGFNFSTDALQEDLTGFLVNVGSDFMKDAFKAGMQYELYDDVNVLSAGIGWRRIQRIAGVINFSKPFNSADDRGVAIANLHYQTGKFYDLIFTIKRVYEDSDTFQESVSVSTVIKPEKLFPNLPF